MQEGKALQISVGTGQSSWGKSSSKGIFSHFLGYPRDFFIILEFFPVFGALELLPGLSWVVQGGDVGREQPLLQMEKTGNSEASTD